MEVIINDTPIVCCDNISLYQLLIEQKIIMNNIAVAINGVIVPKSTWSTVIVETNSNILVIQAVQGG